MQQLQKEGKLADRRSTLHANLLFFRVWLKKCKLFIQSRDQAMQQFAIGTQTNTHNLRM
jgi:hypothetical protein